MAKKNKSDESEAEVSDTEGDDEEKKKKKGKKGSDDEPYDPNAPALPGYVGVGLLVSLVIGWGPLNDAVRGYGPLEDALTRFVICVLACVTAGSLLGRLLDSAPPIETDEADPDSVDGLDSDGENPELANAVLGNAVLADAAQAGGEERPAASSGPTDLGLGQQGASLEEGSLDSQNLVQGVTETLRQPSQGSELATDLSLMDAVAR